MTFPYPKELEAWGYSETWHERFEEAATKGCFPARVVRDHRGYFRVHTAKGALIATTAGRLKHRAAHATELPAVGDFVALKEVREQGHEQGRGVIQRILPRTTVFKRKASGHLTEEQVVASNIDTVFIVSGLDSDYSPRRVERYLILARESGARSVVLLNKADKCADVAKPMREVAAINADIPVHLIAAKPRVGLEALPEYLGAGQTIAFLGSSGAGKSTLINALLNEERQATQEVREADSKGRHTTTERQMFRLAGGALAIDTPGMRELQLWSSADDISGAFADIEALAQSCKFRDCTHQTEPQCAVRAAVEALTLSDDRYSHFSKLHSEATTIGQMKDIKLRLEKKAADKMPSRAQKKRPPRS
ncbi:MAG: ribosome small subunit-dependent GTPase A [Vicinamibacteria bacterium]